jgi:hypothetical protein
MGALSVNATLGDNERFIECPFDANRFGLSVVSLPRRIVGGVPRRGLLEHSL